MEYSKFADSFFIDLATEFVDYTGSNNYTINLVDAKSDFIDRLLTENW